MTIAEFLEKLAATEGPWVLESGSIRCGDHCPITAVGGLPGTTSADYHKVGSKLHLAVQTRYDIADAADMTFGDTPRFRKLRRQLLAATVNR